MGLGSPSPVSRPKLDTLEGRETPGEVAVLGEPPEGAAKTLERVEGHDGTSQVPKACEKTPRKKVSASVATLREAHEPIPCSFLGREHREG